MRITYGIHGYGRGHAARALAVLPSLMCKHEVQIIAGGDAYNLLSLEFPVQRVPTLRYCYGLRGKPSAWRTVLGNGPAVIDILLGGTVLESVQGLVQDFHPDVVISDAEIFTHWIARRLKLPRIGFDHFGVLVYCQPPCHWYDRLGVMMNSVSYRAMFGRPDRVIVSSFYTCPSRGAGVSCVAPLRRKEVLQTRASEGKHLLVYFTKPKDQYTPRIQAALQTYSGPIHVYGLPRRPAEGNLQFLPHSNLPFVEDLASCRAVVSTAGNQLVGEAIYFRKPMLVMPEGTVEQRINAVALVQMGLGMSIAHRRFSVEVLSTFVSRLDEYRANMNREAGKQWVDALPVLEQYLHELAPSDSPRTHEHEMA